MNTDSYMEFPSSAIFEMAEDKLARAQDELKGTLYWVQQNADKQRTGFLWWKRPLNEKERAAYIKESQNCWMGYAAPYIAAYDEQIRKAETLKQMAIKCSGKVYLSVSDYRFLTQ